LVGSVPELADTHHNAAWIEQQQRLLSLAAELQYVPTYSSVDVQRAYAEATHLVRKELSKLDAHKARLWEK
ncbi:hypothetical protein FRC07_009295, partial [Ceratobasidium sp. 392]